MILFLLACGHPLDSADSGADPSGSTCTSGHYWEGGNEESPVMNPGQDCVACHRSGEGPDYTLAGTVMGDYDDEDDCNGVEGVVVSILDADGKRMSLTTNAAGNFYTNDDFALPYTVSIEKDGATREMASEQDDGACNRCHTAAGEEGAPGRIVAP
ncbi:MAG: hypothetical protein FJ102_13900 [Deltaproteobacteria bacterium]|nr:hypothetical protein [Deltaproteobacteria bacterium]